MITYQLETGLSADEFVDVLVRSTLGHGGRFMIGQRSKKMLAEADLIVAARSDEKLVGVSRAITDFSFCTYLSDLAVDEQFQRQGIGELIRRTHEAAGLNTTLVLLSAPAAESYYPHIGMTQHGSCWFICAKRPRNRKVGRDSVRSPLRSGGLLYATAMLPKCNTRLVCESSAPHASKINCRVSHSSNLRAVCASRIGSAR